MSMCLQILYIIDEEPLSAVEQTFDDLCRQKDADVCVVCNSADEEVARWMNANAKQMRAYKYTGAKPLSYNLLFSPEYAFVAHSEYAGYMYAVPGVRVPADYSLTALDALAMYPNANRIVFSSVKASAASLGGVLDQTEKDVLFRDMMTATGISVANVCVRAKHVDMWSNDHTMYAMPWINGVYGLLYGCAVVNAHVPVFELPKSANAFRYFLGQYRYLIDLHKMPYYRTMNLVQPLFPYVVDALHAHGRRAAAFADDIQLTDCAQAGQIRRLSRIMLRQSRAAK
jgi:hypothetical protein